MSPQKGRTLTDRNAVVEAYRLLIGDGNFGRTSWYSPIGLRGFRKEYTAAGSRVKYEPPGKFR